MKIGLIGRHCLQCEKTVVDFTKMPREEVVLYLLQNRGNQVCGRFRKSQLDYYHLEEVITLERLRLMPRNKAFTLLSLVCVMLASCQEPETKPQNSPIETTLADTTQTNVVVDSVEIVSVDTVDTSTKKATPINPIGIETLGIIEMGEVIELPIDTGEVTANGFGNPQQDTTIYHVVEQMPEFPGGIDSLAAFFNHETKWETTKNIAGKIYVQFVVEKDGSISYPTVLRGMRGAPEFDEEALRVVRKMPNWIPGQMNGEPVRVYYTIPLTLSF